VSFLGDCSDGRQYCPDLRRPGLTTLTTVESVRWGIIGVGDVTERKSGPGFQQAERSELVAVMRRNGDLAADYARRHNVPRWYDDADELINDPAVDAVYVATPPDSPGIMSSASRRQASPSMSKSRWLARHWSVRT
jgi:hypothetical protein